VRSRPSTCWLSNVKAHPICNNPLMCGRYRLSRRKQLIEEYFETGESEHEWTPRYNIAPTQFVPVIRQNPKEPVRELSLARWDSFRRGRKIRRRLPR
jgi:hypothetical protein